MRTFTTVVFLFISSTLILAQDTIKVQTFNWKSTTRADTFSFPNSPNETYRKILMIYNMRCHDGIVGTDGSTGCREWDYSCNTFVTDPGRIDSTRYAHADYTISNFNGNSFDYTLNPTYTYYQFHQYSSQLTGSVINSSAIGNGLIDMPLNAGQQVSKAQFLYKASELVSGGLSAGDIQRIKMDISALGSQLTNLRIRLKQTNQTELNADTPELDGFTEVYFKNTDFNVIGLQNFDFYNSFSWDGSSNLLVEISYTSKENNSTTSILAHDTGYNAGIISTVSDYALYFEGSGSAHIPGAALGTISNEITISLWAYGSPKFLPAQSTMFEGSDANNNRQVNVHLPWEDENVYWDCGRNAGGDVNRINKKDDAKAYKGQWSHWAFTKNAATGQMKIYLNGKLWHSGTGLKYPIDLKGLNFGSAIAWTSNYFGSIDEFQVWDKELDEATIGAWMRKSVTPLHPDYSHLVAYFKLDEGQGKIMSSSAGIGQSGSIVLPNWKKIKGVELYKNFSNSSLRPNIVFEQGNFTITNTSLPVIDTVLNSQNQIVHYGLNGTNLVALDTQYVYHAVYSYVYDELGNKIDSINVSKQGTIAIGNLFYYGKRQSRFELVSLVTPYGINLDLSKLGKTFTFDVTDYAPILKGKKYLSIEYGGEWQEELDVSFLFIKGIPPKAVRNIQNIWPEGRGYHGDIQNDNVFEERQLKLDPGASYYKLRSAISGHGGNGEFVSQQHFLNVNGGAQEFTFDVWKACSKNPIYPQGGTWVFDRAGWCPGMATDVHEFDLSPYVKVGGIAKIDYGINGPPLSDANYLVSNQLVTYGDYNFNLDASLETVMRPNIKSVEYERINPACNTPTVLVRNTGATPISSLLIEYNVKGGKVENYTWSGNIDPMMSAEIILPVSTPGFWFSTETKKIFEAKILEVNGIKDDYADNDIASSSFTLAREFSFNDPLQIRFKTNVKAADNSYTVLDYNGNIVLSRNNVANSTTYVDEINVPSGCYTFKFEDTSGDGLSFWFFPENGAGTLRLERLFNGNVQIPLQTFNPDMGGGVQFDFVRGAITAAEDIKSYTLFSIYPNPTEDFLNIELHGFGQEKMQVSVIDLTGREVIKKNMQVIGEKYIDSISLGALNPGMYFLKVNNGKKIWIKQIVKD